MRKGAWILALFFALAFVGATLMNASMVGRARAALLGASPGERRAGSRLPSGARIETMRYHLAVILPDTDDSFFDGLLEGMKAEGPAFGVAVQVFRYPGSSPEEAERFFQIVMASKADGLVMYVPSDEEGLSPVFAQAEEADRNGVVFVPVGTDAPSEEKGLFIGSGSLLQGIEGGKLIGQSLGAAARVGIVVSSAVPAAGSQEPLSRGVSYALESFPGAKVVAVETARPGILSGEAVVESMLRSNPAINAILCSNARDTVGAAQVIVDFNEVGRVLIFGADETPDIKRYIDKGVVAASVVRDSKWIGAEAVRVFVRVKQGGKAPGLVETGFLVVRTKEASR